MLENCGYNNAEATFTEYAPETLGEVFFKAICNPMGRTESKLAAYLRARKLDQAKTEEASKRQAQDAQNARDSEAAREAIKKWEEQNAGKEAMKKPDGAECRTSSECRGVLICGKVNESSMQCMSSDNAIRISPGGITK